MKKVLKVISITCGVVLALTILIVIVLSIGIVHLARGLPTPQPTIGLTNGKQYWINAVIPPKPIPAGLVVTTASIQNKPGSIIQDPSITVIAMVPDSTEVTLVSTQKEWCYVKGVYNSMRYFSLPTPEPPLPTLDFNAHFEGWVECYRLLDYWPTPFPTPNLTPVAP